MYFFEFLDYPWLDCCQFQGIQGFLHIWGKVQGYSRNSKKYQPNRILGGLDSPKLSLDTHRKKCHDAIEDVQEDLILILISRKFSGVGDTSFLNPPTRVNMSGGSAPSHQHYRHFVLYRTAMYKFSPSPANLQNK